uniref:Uncharacterized protein n=1 Tax=Lygus hesperus TaxID=30085 RepID=A0A0K8SKB5_LYGHE
MNCARCGDPLPSDELHATCSAVKDKSCVYHFACTTVSQRTYVQWGTAKQSAWVCPKHREIKKKIGGKGDTSDTDSIKSGGENLDGEEDSPKILHEIRKLFNAKFAEQTELFNKSFEGLKKDIGVQAKRIVELETANLELRKENKELKSEINNLWQISDKNDY